MTLERILARARSELLTLLLESATAVAALVALMLSVPTMLIVAAQLSRLVETGDWREFRFSEFVDVLRIGSAAFLNALPVAGFLFALPAAWILLVVTLVLCLLAGLLHRLSQRERARFNSLRQRAMIEDIERKIEAR